MGFIDAEAVELQVLGESRWELLSPLTYRGRDETFTVPAGTRTDLASVPASSPGWCPATGATPRPPSSTTTFGARGR